MAPPKSVRVGGRTFTSWALAKDWLRKSGTDQEIKDALKAKNLPAERDMGSCDRCPFRASGLCNGCPKWKWILPAFRRSGRLG